MSKPGALIIGVGSIGERHTRCMLSTGRVDVGVVEPNTALRDQIANRYGVLHAYGSLDEALHDHSWSTAVICTPANTHIELALACLEASVPTLIEKPLAVSMREAAALSPGDLSPAIGVAYVYRANPALSEMRKAIRRGRFGKPLQLVANLGQHFPTYRPTYASTYYAKHKTGGGAIQDALTHVFNSAEWLVGPVTRIAVDAQHLALPNVQVEDTVHAMARHKDVMACYSLNQHQAPNETSITVICERGTARLELHRDRWRSQTSPKAGWDDHPFPMTSRDTLFERQASAWLDVIEGKSKPLCTLAEARQTLAVNEAALWSVKNESAWRVVNTEHLTPLENMV